MIAEIIKKTKIINHTKSKIAEIETAELKDACIACIPKKVIWHLAIWQNWCFGQFYHSKIEK